MEGLPTSYQYDMDVDWHDTDGAGVARASSVFRYLQSAANLQMHTCRPSNEELRLQGQAFVVTRFAADFLLPVRAYERVTAKTWALESRGVSFGRCYSLMRGHEVAVLAQSVCALLDVQTGRPLPVTAFHPGFSFEEPHREPLPLRLRMPLDYDLEQVGEYRVTYADTDFNNHMNNTRYPDMLADFLPMQGRRFRSITLNFQKEAPAGSTLRVSLAKVEDTYYFRTLREDGATNIEAAVILTEE